MFAYSFQETYVYHGSVGNGGMENELGRKGKGTRFCQLSILPGGAILSNTNFYIAKTCPVLLLVLLLHPLSSLPHLFLRLVLSFTEAELAI